MTQLLIIKEQINNAKDYAGIFGALNSTDKIKQLKELKAKFAYLARLVHPDFNKGDEQQANELFRHINGLKKNAMDAIEKGIYSSSFINDIETPSNLVFQSTTNIYKLFDTPMYTGDFSTFYRALDATSKEVIVKISQNPHNNSWLKKEAAIYNRFNTEVNKLVHFMPQVLDTFTIMDGKKRLRVNVQPHYDEYISLDKIISKYNGTLDPKHAAWIARRVLSQVMAAKKLGLVHGAITPDHVLVHPLTHEPMHLGWCHSVEADFGRITHVVTRWKDYYPDSIFNKKIATEKVDVYMAGKVIIKLFGGDVKNNTLPSSIPKNIAKVILRCVTSPSTGSHILEQLTKEIRAEWGKAYRPFYF